MDDVLADERHLQRRRVDYLVRHIFINKLGCRARRKNDFQSSGILELRHHADNLQAAVVAGLRPRMAHAARRRRELEAMTRRSCACLSSVKYPLYMLISLLLTVYHYRKMCYDE